MGCWRGLRRGVQTLQRPSNASSSQLADIVTTIRDEAEHRAAAAVAAEIVAAIFERNPSDDPPPAYFGAAAGPPDADELVAEGQKIARAAGLQPGGPAAGQEAGEYPDNPLSADDLPDGDAYKGGSGLGEPLAETTEEDGF